VDKSAPEMQAYAKESGFPWRAVALPRSRDLKILAPLLGPIPQLIVVDNTVKLIIEDTAEPSEAVLRNEGTGR
jgi:hypothetical protein